MIHLLTMPFGEVSHLVKGRGWEIAGVMSLAIGSWLAPNVSSPSFSAGLLGGFLCFFISFFRKLRQHRIVTGTATSTVRSAAQGFTELAGTAEALGEPILSPWSSTPCVWYLYILEELKSSSKGRRWAEVSRESAEQPIGLKDHEDGIAVLYPEQMELRNLPRTVAKETAPMNLYRGGYRHTEYLIRQGDPIFVNGDFNTIRLTGLRAGRLLKGKTHSPAEVKEAQLLVEQYVQDRTGTDSTAVKNEKVHIISYSVSRQCGLLVHGTEADALKNSAAVLSLLGTLWLGLLAGLVYLNFY